VRRLWSEGDRLRPHAQAEVHRVDLSDAVLDILAWGGDPLAFEWFDPPGADRVAAALSLLRQLDAVAGGRVTEIGTRMKRLPVHPRLARMLVAARGREDVARVCALLSERHALPAHPATTTSDLLAAVDGDRALPPHVRDVARRLGQASREIEAQGPQPDHPYDEAFHRAILAGYPDRVARRRASGSPRFLLASGHGAVLGRESGVRDAEFIVAVDAQAGRGGQGSEATIRIASAIDAEWLPADARTEQIHHELDAGGKVRAIAREMYGAIALAERPTAADPLIASALLADAYVRRGLSDADTQLVRRLQFAGDAVDIGALVAAAALGRLRIDDIDLRSGLDRRAAADLERLAPERQNVPSGRTAPLRYEPDGGVTASAKLQELFGLAETPRVGPRLVPVTFELLAPNGRPVQTTQDLRSFWNTTYQQVRKELRGRYPKHPWPEDPWTAPPTARSKRRI
jgi:ATP-dependent helicase HrpB